MTTKKEARAALDNISIIATVLRLNMGPNNADKLLECVKSIEEWMNKK